MLRCEAPVYRPATLREAVRMRAEMPDAVVLAGGTDVMVQVETGQLRPRAIIDVWRLPGLDGIQDEGRHIGAGVTFTELVRHPHVAPVIKEMALTIGAPQIQNRATIGGNVCNASPAGDSLPVWLALDAMFEVASARGARAISAADFFVGYRHTAMAPDELFVGIALPRLVGHTVYRKVGTRAAQSISKVVFAGRWLPGVEARLAFGAVAPVPMRAVGAENALAAGARSVAELVRRDVRPIDDVRSTARYRRAIAGRIADTWIQGLA